MCSIINVAHGQGSMYSTHTHMVDTVDFKSFIYNFDLSNMLNATSPLLPKDAAMT